MRWIHKLLRRISSAIYVWSIVQERNAEWSPFEARQVARREIDAIHASMCAHFNYQASEVTILNERLSRRYDPGMALNEATQRAVEHKKQAEAQGMGLTDQQLAALEHQKQYLRRVVRNA